MGLGGESGTPGDALERVNITTPFAIQEMTLSVALMGTDLIGQARTGTGKTLAFGIPVLQRTVAPHDPDYAEVEPGKPQALIVAPTRELALQVSGDLSLAGADRGIRVRYGGLAALDVAFRMPAATVLLVGSGRPQIQRSAVQAAEAPALRTPFAGRRRAR